MADIDLHTAMKTVIEAGGADPSAVIDELVETHGEQWAKNQGMTRWRETLEREAQVMLSRYRREIQRSIRGDDAPEIDLMELRFWVPTKGGPVWKRLGDLTLDDHQLRIAHLRRLGGAIFEQARWHENIAAMMVARGATRTEELGELPELPHVGPPGHPRLEIEAA